MVHSQDYGTSLTALDQYSREVKRSSPLTNEEEVKLLRCINDNVDGQRALDRLVEGYQPLMIGLARRFVRHCQHMELLDLVQEGSIGLLQAIQKYEIGKSNASFRTFAFAWARGAMLTAFWQNEDAIRLPLNKVKAIRQMMVVNSQLLSLLGREPTIAETAQEMQMKERDVLELVVLQEQQVVSLHSFPSDDDELSLEDVLAAPSVSAFNDSRFSSVDDALASLPERERVVVHLRYGFHDGRPYTQKEVAGLLGIACSTVASLDRRAHMRLREALSEKIVA